MHDRSAPCAQEYMPASHPLRFDRTAALLDAARSILVHLEAGRRVDATLLRDAMEASFNASDAAGAWDWKLAYDACEAATVLFLRKYGKALLHKAGSPAAALPLHCIVWDLGEVQAWLLARRAKPIHRAQHPDVTMRKSRPVKGQDRAR